MTSRRPLVLSGQFIHEADNTDGVPILGSITYGSGLGDQTSNFKSDYTANTFVAAEPSGLIYVLEGSDFKLGVDGSAQVNADAALISANAALADVEPANASGLEAQRIAVEALASGNAALFDNTSALASGNAAILQSVIAIASGDAAYATAAVVIAANLNAIASGEYALVSGVDADADAVDALASGNAALTILATNPFVSSETVVGLIFTLS